MKPFRRWIIYGSITISLLLCFASIVLEARGYRVYERFQFSGTVPGGVWRSYIIDSVRGEIYISIERWQFPDDASAALYARRYPTPQGFFRGTRALMRVDAVWRYKDTWWSRIGFRGFSRPLSMQRPGPAQSFTVSWHSLYIPDWFAAGVTAIIPAAAILLVALSIRGCWQQIQAIRHDPERRQIDNALNDIHQSNVTGPIYANNPLIPILANQRPYLLDTFMAHLMRQQDPQFGTKLWDDLDHARFSACIIHSHPAEWGSDWVKDDAMIRAHLSRYHLKSIYGPEQVYLPNPAQH